MKYKCFGIFQFQEVDLFELNYVYHPKFNLSLLKGREFWFEKFFWYKILFYLGLLTKSIWSSPLCFKSFKNVNVVFVSFSINNYRTIKGMVSHFNNSIIITHKSNNDTADVQLPLSYAYLVSLLYLPSYLRYYRKQTGTNRVIVKRFLPTFLLTYGYLHMASKVVNRTKPKMMVFANDTIMPSRAFNYLCRRAGISTSYIQHASVTEKFPPLDFTLSFLDGYDSLEKYCAISRSAQGTVILSGAPRYDELLECYRKVSKVSSIGIAINLIDNEELVTSFVLSIRALINKDIQIVIRPHPRMKNLSFWKEFSNQGGFSYSDTLTESSLDYLKLIDFQISNNSGIHLDATLMGIPSVVYNFSLNPDKISDPYKYVAKGLVKKAESIEDVVSYINNFEECFAPGVTNKFVANFNAGNSINSSKIVCDTIASYISSNSLPAYLKVNQNNSGNSFYVIKY